MSLDFERPPINEVVFGVAFSPVPALKAEAIGLYWAHIRETFPFVSQQPVYMPQALAMPLVPQAGELFPLPRFWFLSADKTRLIQLQNNAFLYNWRKQEGEYPRFSRVAVEFFEHLKGFLQFVESELSQTVTFASAELAYINLFGEAESLKVPIDYLGISKVFPDYPSFAQDLDLENFNHVDFFRLPAGNQMAITQRSGRQPWGNSTNVVLEIKITGALTVAINEWFFSAHEQINDTFLKITRPDAQRLIWKKK
jgi:uncharacterized protein (TIGR04255 family)